MRCDNAVELGPIHTILHVSVPSPFPLHSLRLICVHQWRTEGGFGVFKPPPEIPKISVESSIAQARRTGVSISFYSSVCSHTVVIY